ncbi:MAG: hypothetical protein CM15mP127_00960 [Gammaproteobacteria bacterium]|nr:MAG: hypothetical protein CM15mP127_00960 [Gammaproteobacteria bacterium]
MILLEKRIHPEYREVLFHDVSVDEYFVINSTLKTDQTKKWKDGKTYPYYTLDVSSASHPFTLVNTRLSTLVVASKDLRSALEK